MTDSSDAEALTASVTRSRTRFLELYEPQRPALFRFCRYLTRSPWDGEDLAQDTLARAFATLGASISEPPRDPRAWLFRIASNLWIDQVRRRELQPREPAPTAVAADQREAREAAGTLLVQLSPQERAAVVLKDVFDLGLEDIAAILSTSAGAVKAALHRGRGKIADPDPEVARAPAPGVLDAFCAAFNARDLDRVTALLLDHAAVEIVGATMIHGAANARGTALTGLMFGSKRMAAIEDGGEGEGIDPAFSQRVLPEPARLELRVHRGEPILVSWYAHRDGSFVRAVSRVEVDEATDQISRLRNYFFTPEVIAEVCDELELPYRTNGTFRARG